MRYEYWGYIGKRDDGIWEEKRPQDEQPKPIDPNKLSEEFKTKIAMLDFMNDHDKLPCGSYKVRLDFMYDGLKTVAYFLYVEVSSARGEGGNGV